jgi:hypothetical protein
VVGQSGDSFVSLVVSQLDQKVAGVRLEKLRNRVDKIHGRGGGKTVGLERQFGFGFHGVLLSIE